MKKFLICLILFFGFIINVKANVSLKIDGVKYEEFTIEKTNYQLKDVDSSKTNMEFDFSYSDPYEMSNAFQIVNLKYGKNNYSFTITNKETNESKTYNFEINKPDNRSSDNSLTSLTVGDNKIVLTDSNEYNVTVDGKLTSIEVKANLPDKASFIDGYGERIGTNSVKLNNQITTVEIRVKAENENVRTYKININKTNTQSNDATLKSLKIENVDFDFKSNIFEYDISVKYNISNIKIEAIKNNEKASVDYVENVNLEKGINNIEIKVIAEDSTIKIYKLNITREEEIPLVKEIKITGIDFEFNPKTYNYKIETNLEKLDFNVTLGSETATCEIIDNNDLKNNSIVKIEAKDEDDTVTYSFKIVNKEETDEESIVTSTNTNNVNNFFKQNEMIIGLVVFGIGILSCLIAILIKRKSKVL